MKWVRCARTSVANLSCRKSNQNPNEACNYVRYCTSVCVCVCMRMLGVITNREFAIQYWSENSQTKILHTIDVRLADEVKSGRRKNQLSFIKKNRFQLHIIVQYVRVRECEFFHFPPSIIHLFSLCALFSRNAYVLFHRFNSSQLNRQLSWIDMHHGFVCNFVIFYILPAHSPASISNRKNFKCESNSYPPYHRRQSATTNML